MTTPAEKDAMALAVLVVGAQHLRNAKNIKACHLRDAASELEQTRAHLAARLAELEMEAAGATAAYERFTAYTIVHDGAMRYCSSEMRDAYAEMSERATRAEAELAAEKVDAERYRWLRVQNANTDNLDAWTITHCDFTDEEGPARYWVGADLDAAIDAARGA